MGDDANNHKTDYVSQLKDILNPKGLKSCAFVQKLDGVALLITDPSHISFVYFGDFS